MIHAAHCEHTFRFMLGGVRSRPSRVRRVPAPGLEKVSISASRARI